MKIGLIYEARGPDWPTRDLQTQARKINVNLQLIRIADLSAHLKSERLSVLVRDTSAKSFDGFIVRGLGWPTILDRIQHRVDLLHSLEEMRKPVMNPPKGILLARDKERSLATLALKGFKVPETFITENLSAAMKVARRFKHQVIKPLQGSKGLGVVSVDDEDSAYQVLRTVAQTSGVFYLQRRILNLNENLRVFTVGREALGCMRLKPRKGAWKSNVAQGGTPSKLRDYETEAKLAVEAANSLGLWYAGVDLLITDQNEALISEVNACPSWRVFSQVTGTNPGRRILQFMIEKVGIRFDAHL